MRYLALVIYISLSGIIMVNAQNAIKIEHRTMTGGVQKIERNYDLNIEMHSKLVGNNPEMNQRFAQKNTKSMTKKHSVVREYYVAILAVDAQGPCKVKIDVRADEKNIEEQSPVQGKSYLVHRVGQNIMITGAQGQAVEGDEKDRVLALSADLTCHNPLSEIFAGRTFSIGSALEMEPSKALALFGTIGDDEAPKVQKFVVTLREIKMLSGYKCAWFDLSILSNSPGQSKPMELTGQIVVGVDNAWIFLIKTSGSGTIAQTNHFSYGKIEMSGSVSMKMQYQMTYSEK